jgi:ubiquitin-protein ligase
MDLCETTLQLLLSHDASLYLGGRYGLTPHTAVSSAAIFGTLHGRGVPTVEPLCVLATSLQNTVGEHILKKRFTDAYTTLEQVDPEAEHELALLGDVALPIVHLTGSYSERIFHALRPRGVACGDEDHAQILPDGQRSDLVMLHGRQSAPDQILLTDMEVDDFTQRRSKLSGFVRSLLQKPSVSLGADRARDKTFLNLCRRRDARAAPIYVVDPRELDAVTADWGPDRVQHLRMTPSEFLARLRDARRGPPSRESPSAPPPPTPRASPPGPSPGRGPAPAPRAASEPSDDGPVEPPGGAPPRPPARIPIYVQLLDRRRFRVEVAPTMRVSQLASQVMTRFGLAEEGRVRALVDVARRPEAAGAPSAEQPAPDWTRCNPERTVAEEGIRAEDTVRVFGEPVAGAALSLRREKALGEIQPRLERLAREESARIEVHPNLPVLADRFDLTLHCGGWEVVEGALAPEHRVGARRVELSFPPEFPDAPPVVRWREPIIFHPNVDPKRGFVCLGALQEAFTPLFGPVELVRMLIDVAEYRSYDLHGVLNTEAAYWAQLHQADIQRRGGWAFQRVMERGPGEGERREEGEPLDFQPSPIAAGLSWLEEGEGST